MGHRRDRAPVRGWSLAQLFGLTVGLLVILLGFLFTLVFRGSQDAILESSEQQRKLVSQRIADSVAAYLGQAEASIVDLQREIQGATLDLKDFTAIEAALYADLINHPNLTEVTVTYGWDDGWDADGNLRLLPGHRGQISVYRPDPAGKKINTRELSWANGGFEVRARRRGDADAFDSVPLKLVHPTTPPQDPTQDPTFTTPARQDLFGAGQPVWSDLAWTEMDKALPPAQRRVEVSVQKAITNRRGGFLGVVRVGIQAQRLDQCTRGTGLDPGDKHQVFLCDAQGRLITRVSPHDTIEEMGDDLRVHPSDPPPAIAAALHLPILGQVSADTPQQHGSFDLGGETFLTTFRYLSNTQDWIAGIVVPKSYYLGNLEDSRRRLLIAFLAIDVLLLVGGIGSLRFMRQGMHQITNE
ncbi:MAG TPA: cache domain-containing protein, partial [Candidatus Xenobia bacterium]